jgi:hypothetical protein
VGPPCRFSLGCGSWEPLNPRGEPRIVSPTECDGGGGPTREPRSARAARPARAQSARACRPRSRPGSSRDTRTGYRRHRPGRGPDAPLREPPWSAPRHQASTRRAAGVTRTVYRARSGSPHARSSRSPKPTSTRSRYRAKSSTSLRWYDHSRSPPVSTRNAMVHSKPPRSSALMATTLVLSLGAPPPWATAPGPLRGARPI